MLVGIENHAFWRFTFGKGYTNDDTLYFGVIIYEIKQKREGENHHIISVTNDFAKASEIKLLSLTDLMKNKMLVKGI